MKLFLAFGIPAFGVLALTLHASHDVSAIEMPFAFALNFPYIAAPQVAFFIIDTVVRFHTLVVLGGLLALDIWLVCFEWLLFHSASREILLVGLFIGLHAFRSLLLAGLSAKRPPV